MTLAVVAICAVLVGYWLGVAHTRWLMRSELRSLTRRVGEYVQHPDPRKPW